MKITTTDSNTLLASASVETNFGKILIGNKEDFALLVKGTKELEI